MRKSALGLSILAAILGSWAVFNAQPGTKPVLRMESRKSVEAYTRSLIEPAKDSEAWRLKRPYPSPEQVEQAIGKADESSSQYTWATKYVWRTGEGETVAWFSKADGGLNQLELNYGGIERIARDPAGYLHQPARLK